MIGKKLINTGGVEAAFLPSQHFDTITYTGNGGTQRIGGYINKGAVFNGTNSEIAISATANTPFDPSQENHTVSFWFNLSGNAADQIFMGKWSSTFGRSWQIVTTTSNRIRIWENDGTTSRSHDSTNTYSTNTWHHLAYVRNGSSVIIYIDGQADTISETNSLSSGGTSNIQIGNQQGSSAYLTGKIDQVRIFNKALSSSEVTTLYGETAASTSKSVTDIFEDNSGVALYQLDGNANDTGGGSGKYGSAFIGDGTTRYISTGISNNDIEAFSFWFYFVSGTSVGRVLGSTTRYYENLWVEVGTNGYISLQLQNLRRTTSSGALGSTGWKHIYYDTNRNLYINGVATSGTDLTGSEGNSSAIIGALRTDYGFYNERIDDVRYYSSTLTLTQIGYLANNDVNNANSIPNLLAHYKLDGNALDETGTYNGTEVNAIYKYDGTAANVTYQKATDFQPDLVWIKGRSFADNHQLTDSVRGNTKYLISNSTNTESTSTIKVTSFDSNGFTLGSDTPVNNNNQTHVAWCFKGGGSVTPNNNTVGSITSTVSANPDAGFSIVKYTAGGAANVGHGLSSAPELIIAKTTDVAANWWVYHKDVGTGKYLKLNTTGATTTDSAVFSSVSSSTFTNNISSSSYTYINYCFHSVDGYQKLGSYTGTGLSGGNIIETGFEPAWLMVKRTDGASEWTIFDNTRDSVNPNEVYLEANTSNVEATGRGVNFLSNGFEWYGTSQQVNASGGTYIYLAIAADPDVTQPTVENSFDVVTYTGNGGTQTINTDFKPDLVWTKSRSTTGSSHTLYDSVRGVSKFLISNAANAENNGQASNTGGVTSFNSNGFDITLDSSFNLNNYSGRTYVAWCWKAGDHDDNLPQINTNGTIDSIVSVNAAAGFSIVKYTGNTLTNQSIGHGLSSAPELIIIKNLDDGTANWLVGGENINYYLRLNLPDADPTSSSYTWITNRNTTTFTVGSQRKEQNINGQEFIAYCFHSVNGYQKVGSFVGDGSTDAVLNLGFEPRWIMIKNTDTTTGWFIMDVKRSDFALRLRADTDAQESSIGTLTTSATGITISSTASDGRINGRPSQSDTMIYLAIA